MLFSCFHILLKNVSEWINLYGISVCVYQSLLETHTHTHTRPLEMFVCFFLLFSFHFQWTVCSFLFFFFFLSSTGNDSFCLSQWQTKCFKQLIVKMKTRTGHFYHINIVATECDWLFICWEWQCLRMLENLMNQLSKCCCAMLVVVLVLLPHRSIGWLECRLWCSEISCRRGRIMDFFCHQWIERK